MMEWSEIVGALGGGPIAIMLMGVSFWGWQERKANLSTMERLDALYERLIEKTNDHLADSIKRETETLSTLREIAASIRGGRNV